MLNLYYACYQLLGSLSYNKGMQTKKNIVIEPDVTMPLPEGVTWAELITLIKQEKNQKFLKKISPKTFKFILEESNRPTASSEIKEAIQDLSKRPEPDVTGAIHHAMAALECVARDICGDSSATLGNILQRYPDELDLPRPLDDGLKKFWGYASQVARHVSEGNSVDYIEAELMVRISAVVSTYLSKKHS